MRRRTAVQMLGTLALMAPAAVSKLWAQGEKKDRKEASSSAATAGIKGRRRSSRLHPARPDI